MITNFELRIFWIIFYIRNPYLNNSLITFRLDKLTGFWFDFKAILFAVFRNICLEHKEIARMSIESQWTSKFIWSECDLGWSSLLIIQYESAENNRRKLRFYNEWALINLIPHAAIEGNSKMLVFFFVTKTRRHILTIDIVIISDKLLFEGLCLEIYDTTRSKSHGCRHQNPDNHKHDNHLYKCESWFYQDKWFFHLDEQIKYTVYVWIIHKLSIKNYHHMTIVQ